MALQDVPVEREAVEAKASAGKLHLSEVGGTVSTAGTTVAYREVSEIKTRPGGSGGGGAAGGAARLVRLRSFPSAHVAPRPVHIWLPECYEADTDRYAVLYMHDGQNVFEDAGSTFGTSWRAGDILGELIREGVARKAIIVGIFSAEALRFREFAPGPTVERLDATTRERLLALPEYGGPLHSAAYVRFLVEELKPHIDATYRTEPDAASTFLMGSSMGGLISWYALALHPDVFGGAGCLSTHWPLTIDPETLVDEASSGWRHAVTAALLGHLGEALPAAGRHRLWFDHGDRDLDAHYAPYQEAADTVLAAKGYHRGMDWVSGVYRGTGHNEAAWRDRLREPLAFLLCAV